MQQEIRTTAERSPGGLWVYIKRMLLICCGALLMAINIKTFVRAGNLFPGGFTGLALLIQRVALQFFSVKLPYSPIVIILNSVPVVISFKYIGRRFTLYSCLMIVLSSV
ncbi:MAG: YitT family protein, partial [Treponema sp.]|nr:YitT family protein [Treponema sp.]